MTFREYKDISRKQVNIDTSDRIIATVFWFVHLIMMSAGSADSSVLAGIFGINPQSNLIWT